MIGIALLGAGRIGQVHGRTLKSLPGARVTAVADFVPEAASALAADVGGDVRDIEAILKSDDVDAVVIGTPTATHYDLIHQAAAAGKAIFCEKPVDLSSERIRACLDAVEAAGVPFMVAFNRRFDPHFAAVAARVRAGEIGDVESVTIISRDPGAPPLDYIKQSGGLFRDMTIHDFDMARFLLGEDPVEVQAMASCLTDPAIGSAGDVDTAMVTLRTGTGKLAQISNSRRATYGYDQRIEVHGSKGMLRASNVQETQVELANETGFRTAPLQNFFLERYEAAYRAEMAHFAACLNAGTAPTPTGDDGLKAQLLADAAAEAAASGQPQKV